MVDGRRTALIVVAAEAEPAVGDLRRRLDPVADLGVPAHVTVLFPFMPVARITDRVAGRLAAIVADVACFEYDLVAADWFGDDVLWLAPDPAERFRELTASIAAAFPDFPPYGGVFEEVVPHLTVADRAPLAGMRAAERTVREQLPIRAVARAVTLLAEDDSGRWQADRSFALG